MFSLDPEIVALALDSARMATWEWIPSTDQLRWTSGQAAIYSRPSTEINSSAAWTALIHPDDRERVRLAVKCALETETGFREHFRVSGKDEVTLWIFGYATVRRRPDRTLVMSGLNMDVTEWFDTLHAAEVRFTATFEQAAVGMAHVATDGKWLNMNSRCCEIVGYSKKELLGMTFADITHPDDLDADWALVRALLAGERSTYSMEKRYITRERQLVWVNLTVSLVLNKDAKPDYFITVIEDITARKRLEAERDELIVSLEERVRERTAELEKLIRTDVLTGIANRRRFDEHFEVEWGRAARARQPLSMVIVDIDYFKGLNDSLGHAIADRALISVAKELMQSAQRSSDLAARYGGDEFVLLLPDTGPEGALKVATKIEEAIRRLELPNPGSPVSAYLTVSQGVASASPTQRGAHNILALAADRALYKAKENGRNGISVDVS